jgi:hypothetical protein
MTRTRYPQSGLAALLDALEQELLAAPVDEVCEAWRGTGRARNIARQEISALLNAAIAASEDSSALQHLPPDTFTGLDRRLIVSRELRAAPHDYPHPTHFLLRAAAGIDGESRFCKPEQTGCTDPIELFSRQASPMSPLGALRPFPCVLAKVC